jgi:signal peptidase I
MISGFKNRKPWAASIIAFLLGPTVGMCYLSRGRLALVYLAFLFGLLSLIFAVVCHGFLNLDRNLISITSLILLPLRIVGLAHCVYLATKRPEFDPVKWYGRWYGLLFLFLFAPFLFALTFRAFCYEPFHIPSASMSPTIIMGDYLFVEKFAYWNRLPQRGDVVVFRNPKKSNNAFIKRIVGLPKDKVQMIGGVPYINGTPLLHTANACEPVAVSCSFAETLPQGKAYTILLHRTISHMEDTPVYEVPENQYFVLGDNRDNSNDSRFSDEFGFVPQSTIVGKAIEIIFNYQNGKFNPRPIN